MDAQHSKERDSGQLDLICEMGIHNIHVIYS